MAKNDALAKATVFEFGKLPVIAVAAKHALNKNQLISLVSENLTDAINMLQQYWVSGLDALRPEMDEHYMCGFVCPPFTVYGFDFCSIYKEGMTGRDIYNDVLDALYTMSFATKRCVSIGDLEVTLQEEIIHSSESDGYGYIITYML